LTEEVKEVQDSHKHEHEKKKDDEFDVSKPLDINEPNNKFQERPATLNDRSETNIFDSEEKEEDFAENEENNISVEEYDLTRFDPSKKPGPSNLKKSGHKTRKLSVHFDEAEELKF
jgi:hypothetical protein